ncbi:NADPH-dependent FMN reductase [Rhodococcus sp. NPDC059968]|uniref:NADPH-dependent FMN reductase n=1 Tax=Rhodococcus sp. NPDC059968 TaxID=3347017 RepID=UPI0036701EA1
MGIIVGSTRPGRRAADVAAWVYTIARRRSDAQFEVVDLLDFHLPMLDEEIPPSYGQYTHDHTKAWAAKIASFDGFIFVTPEYNHSIPGALKNAVDFVYGEWNDKAAGFVGYGSAGGTRAVEHLRQVMAEVKVAGVRTAVALSLFTDFVEFQEFRPADFHKESVDAMLDQLISWSRALQTNRTPETIG